MSYWPDMKLGPISSWPGAMTKNRQRSPFREGGQYASEVALGDTLEVLERELRMLKVKNAELLLAIRPQDFRLDGKPRAQAIAEHPGVILSFESKHGALSYPCDTFTSWQANLRAIALALEALRKGEQYRGFLALEAMAMPAGISSTDEALDVIFEAAELNRGVGVVYEAEELVRFVRRAKFMTHPDTLSEGGDPDAYSRVVAAESFLMAEGSL